jgi:hypothetical protein
MCASVNRELVESFTWVPISPWSVVGDPDYDDRLMRALQRAFAGYNVEMQEWTGQTENSESDHKTGTRIRFDDLLEILKVDEEVLAFLYCSGHLMTLDEVLTTSKSLKCCGA